MLVFSKGFSLVGGECESFGFTKAFTGLSFLIPIIFSLGKSRRQSGKQLSHCFPVFLDTSGCFLSVPGYSFSVSWSTLAVSWNVQDTASSIQDTDFRILDTRVNSANTFY